jgi:hypothetical protein
VLAASFDTAKAHSLRHREDHPLRAVIKTPTLSSRGSVRSTANFRPGHPAPTPTDRQRRDEPKPRRRLSAERRIGLERRTTEPISRMIAARSKLSSTFVKDGLRPSRSRIWTSRRWRSACSFDHRNDLVAERTRVINRLRWHLLNSVRSSSAGHARGLAPSGLERRGQGSWRWRARWLSVRRCILSGDGSRPVA